jgi:hypothetical protein
VEILRQEISVPRIAQNNETAIILCLFENIDLPVQIKL